MNNKRTKTKHKLRFRNFFFLCFILVLFGSLFYYFYQLPIQNIIIHGNSYLSDYDIIETAGIKNYPPIFQMNRRSLIEKIKELDFVKEWGTKFITLLPEIVVW